ncbi:MAG: hypothetical protein RLZZ298_656 [Pseudomonadota bacterium]|jgi:transcriptional antiterminator Rof (Rho-off)
MNSGTNNNLDLKTEEAMHHRWLPVEALQPGMVLAKPVQVTQHGLLTMKLAEGVELQANTIDQLFSHDVECVAVKANSEFDQTHRLALNNAYHERLLQIFACASEADLPTDNQELFAALLKVGPQI